LLKNNNFYLKHSISGECFWHNNNYGGRTPNVRNFRLEIADYLGVDVKSLERKIMGTHYYVFTLDEETKKDYACVYGYDRSA